MKTPIEKEYRDVFRQFTKRNALEPWKLCLDAGDILKIQEQAQFLREHFGGNRPRHKDDQAIHHSLQVLLGFTFHDIEEALDRRDMILGICAGIELGLQWGAILNEIAPSVPTSLGRPIKGPWAEAEKIFKAKVRAGTRMTEGKLWLLCNGYFPNRETFHRGYQRKWRGWLDSLSRDIKP